jgi:2-hydroxychromene-2-carboxylate isomerase
MTNRPIWYFDVVSPFAYLALAEVERFAEEQDILFRPIVFGAVLSHWGQLGPAEMPTKRLHTYRLCQFIADQRGAEFRFPPKHPFNSLALLRLITALGSRAATVRTVFDFVFRDGRDAGDPAAFAELCTLLGVADFETLIASGDAKTVLRRNTEEAIAAGVFGVPTLVLDGELFWGLDAMAFARAYAKDRSILTGEMARLKTLPIGAERARK